eukprot:s3000_g5.t1
MITWSCPASFPSTVEQRKKSGCLLPEDMTREGFADALLKTLRKTGHMSSLKNLVVAKEYHKKYMAHGGRAVHYHAVLAMQSPFAHKQMSDYLSSQFSIKAWFTFNLLLGCMHGLTGFAAYLRYLFEVGGKKLEVDREPFVHPPDSLSWEKIQTMIAQMPRDQQVKNNLFPRRQVKRKSMTFAELTDIVVSRNIQTQDDLWKEAKARKMDGDDSLWNRCGDDKALQGTLQKILSGWFGNPLSVFRTSSPYSLSSFTLPKEAEDWVNGAWKERTLILSGGGGIGKTSLAAALLLKVAKQYVFVTRLDQLRGVTFVPDCGFLWDEATMKGLDVDEMKCVMDLEHRPCARYASKVLPLLVSLARAAESLQQESESLERAAGSSKQESASLERAAGSSKQESASLEPTAESLEHESLEHESLEQDEDASLEDCLGHSAFLG